MEIKGDFLGFEFNKVRSESLGIVRTSDGDRYSENLQPEIKDISTEVPGMDGEYYFGSTYGKQTITVSFAFDSMTESQFRKMRRVFACGKISELIFDERPYKKYLAKIESPIELSYVCFDEKEYIEDRTQVGLSGNYPLKWSGKTQRVYKGDGQIEFVCYFPFAKSAFKVLPTTGYDNVNDWAVSSGILSAEEYSGIDEYEAGVFHLYNAGDVKTGFRLYCPKPEIPTQGGDTLIIVYQPYPGQGIKTQALALKDIVIDSNDMGIIINTDNNLIEGVADYTKDLNGNISYRTTGRIYNNYIDSGHFFKLELNDLPNEATLTVTGTLATQSLDIYYDYLYF